MVFQGVLATRVWAWLWGAGDGGITHMRCNMGLHWRLRAIDRGTSSLYLFVWNEASALINTGVSITYAVH